MEKVILITGASRGLGKVIYDYLSEKENYRVYGTSRNPYNCDLLKLDITEDESVYRCITKILQNEGKIDVLINNAGSNIIGSFEGTSIEEFNHQLDINCLGTFKMIQGILPTFRKLNTGQIINISSIGAKVPLPYNSVYAASKAALDAMTESLAYELHGSGIRISLVSPLGLTIENEKPNIQYVQNEKPWNWKSKKLYEKMLTKVTPSVSKRLVAARVEQIISSNEVKLKYTVGKGGKMLILIHGLLPNKMFYKLLKKGLR